MSKILFLKGVSMQEPQFPRFTGSSQIEGDQTSIHSDLYDNYLYQLLSDSVAKHSSLAPYQQKGRGDDNKMSETMFGGTDTLLQQYLNKESDQPSQRSHGMSSGFSCKERLVGFKFTTHDELESISKRIQGVVSCFHCTLILEQPIYAIKHDQSKFTIKAVFCSYVCGFSFGNGFKNITKSNNFKQLLKNYFKLQQGRVMSFKNITVDRADYCKFGGLLSHEQFKSHIRQQEQLLIQS